MKNTPVAYSSDNYQVDKCYISFYYQLLRITSSESQHYGKVTQPSKGQAVDMRRVGICKKAVIAMENQTYFVENISNLYFLQFCFKTEGFLSHFSFGKTFSFSLKTEGNTNFSLKLKLKVFQRKPSVFSYKKLKEN